MDAATTTSAFAVAGISFAWVGWHVGRRWGARGLAVAWLTSAVAITALMAVRIQQRQAALGFSAEQQQQVAAFPRFLPMWAAALGAVALLLRGQLRTRTATDCLLRRCAPRPRPGRRSA